ncbi:dicarboxylate carrier UCP2-like isoform X2 [Channa argus]|uniref:dicarboxylate carrier UCP2-like isoform X2 n=1 Tax=Channa argus TaxID=215402 RepID=UPI0035227814
MVGLGPADVPPSAAVKFVGAGTAACIADLLTFPLDTAKVRLQIQGEGKAKASAGKGSALRYQGVYGTIITMVRTEGPRSLYNGLVAGLQRQMSFASVRIGLYDSVKQFYTKCSDRSDIGIGTRLLAGCTTGAMAVAFAQPTDVVKVRFQAQARSSAHARCYCSTIDAYKTIAKEEGIRGLWKGTAPNIARNAIVNCTELVTYDFIKDTLLKSTPMTDNLPCHLLSAFGAGLCTTVIASPVDVIKTRYMNSAPGQYSSVLDCAAAMMNKEGPLAFYKGFMPSFLRLGSWNVVMFVTYEQLKRAMMSANHNCTTILSSYLSVEEWEQAQQQELSSVVFTLHIKSHWMDHPGTSEGLSLLEDLVFSPLLVEGHQIEVFFPPANGLSPPKNRLNVLSGFLW